MDYLDRPKDTVDDATSKCERKGQGEEIPGIEMFPGGSWDERDRTLNPVNIPFVRCVRYITTFLCEIMKVCIA